VETLGSKQAAPLIEYLRAPNPTTVLAVAVPQALAASHWLRSAVPAAAAVEIPELAGRALAGWLRSRASAEGLELADDAAQLLIAMVGDDPAALVGEMGKAALAGGPENRRVGTAEVRAVVGEHRSHEVFELTRAVERRDGAAALLLLERLLAAGEEPLRILAILSSQSRHAAPRAVGERLERCWQVERRLKLGAPYLNRAKRRWTAREDRLLGTKPDREVGRILCRSPQAVLLRRLQLRKPNRHGDLRRWTSREVRLLGAKPDRAVAKLTGRTERAVRLKRWKARILRRHPRGRSR